MSCKPGFTKIIKNKAYFKRYQVKFRRRREGKTDYFARKRLILQDKNKYNTPKYRLVVRFTNRDVIAQLIYAKIVGDFVVCAAYAHELPRYGVKVGLTNYAAAYATGLLLARRHLANLGLADQFPGNEDIGKFVVTGKSGEGRRPFKALLDVGLKRTTSGARVFAALKGASDGGLYVPHSAKRFIGSQGNKADPEMIRKYITGGHVSEWMEELKERDSEAYERQFSRFIKNGISASDVEAMYLNAHKAIRADPSFKSTAKPRPDDYVQKRFNPKKRTLAARKNRVRQVLAARAAAAQ
jgi:large subunit ribosomal protein L5e